MKQFRIAIALIATSMLLCACPKDENGHQHITFANKSDKIIGYQFSFDKISNISQDTTFHCNKTSEGFINNNSSFILACPARVGGWESDLNDLYYIQFLVMDGNSFNHYYREPCDTVRKYVPILHCFRLSLEDLQRMNWTVVFPPEE